MSSTSANSQPILDAQIENHKEVDDNETGEDQHGVITPTNQPTWTDSTNVTIPTNDNKSKVIKESCIYTHPDETVTTTEKVTHILPPMDCSGDLVNLNKQFTVEVYENERYAPFSNWSASSLLPSDRSNYSIKDGADGYGTLAEVNIAYLSKGWSFVTDSQWKVEIVPNKTDAEGWIYAVNFGSIEDGVSTKGIMHFVRRRKLTRDRIFDIKNICDTTTYTNCFCDSIEVEKISYQLIQAVSSSSLLRYPNHISLPKMNMIKNDLIAMLSLDLNSLQANCKLSSSSTSNSTANSNSSNSNTIRKPSITTSVGSNSSSHSIYNSNSNNNNNRTLSTTSSSHLDEIKSRIQIFGQQGRSIWSSAASVLGVSSSSDTTIVSSENNQLAVNRLVEIADHFFPFVERTEIAKLILRIHDNEGLYHCLPMIQNHHDLQHSITTENIIFDLSSQTSSSSSSSSLPNNKLSKTSPSSSSTTTTTTTNSTITTLSCTIENCQFIPFHCVNPDCTVIISKKWAQQHDDVCIKKLVACPRHCHMTSLMKREEVKHHLSTVCDLKPVQCPFYELGCIADLVQKEVPAHVDACTNSHLLLALNTVRDQAVMVKTLDQRLIFLQDELRKTNLKLNETQASVVGVTTAITVAEQRQMRQWKSQVAETDEKLSQRISSVDSHSRSEVTRLSKYMVDLNTKIQQISLQLKPK